MVHHALKTPTIFSLQPASANTSENNTLYGKASPRHIIYFLAGDRRRCQLENGNWIHIHYRKRLESLFCFGPGGRPN